MIKYVAWADNHPYDIVMAVEEDKFFCCWTSFSTTQFVPVEGDEERIALLAEHYPDAIYFTEA